MYGLAGAAMRTRSQIRAGSRRGVAAAPGPFDAGMYPPQSKGDPQCRSFTAPHPAHEAAKRRRPRGVSAEAYALVAATVALGAFVQGTAGVGFAIIVAPVLAAFAPGLLPVCVLALMMPLNVYVAWRERRWLDLRAAGWVTAGRFLGTFGGVWLLASVSAAHLGTLVGAATVLAALATLLAPRFETGRGAFGLAGIVTGVSETATGIGGPPLALVFQHHPAPVLRATIAACFLVGQAISLAMLGATGQAHAAQFAIALLLSPAVALGALASRLAHRRVGGRPLRVFVLLFALVSGAALLLRP